MSTVLDIRILWALVVFMTISAFSVNCQKSYFDEIKDAMHSLKSFVRTGLEGLDKLAKSLEVVEQFVDATIDEDCEPFTCPKGIQICRILFTQIFLQFNFSQGLIREVNPLHKPESNGCGSFGYIVLPATLAVHLADLQSLYFFFSGNKRIYP